MGLTVSPPDHRSRSTTECTPPQLDFAPLASRSVVGRFDGGTITSDAGALLLREVDRRVRLFKRLTACFTDLRDPSQREHTCEQLLRQRVYAIALGYEDLNDHERLRTDPLLAVLAGKEDPTGATRKRARDRDHALAGKSTLNRLELRPVAPTPKEHRYKKILMDPESVDQLLVDLFLEAHDTPPAEIILDLDATDDPVHGQQEGRFFHGYYKEYCYLPLYIFAGEHLLCARLREANQDASAGAVEEVERIIGQIRLRWPAVHITLRADSGFCREALMNWCEQHQVDYVFGLAKNVRLLKLIEAEQAQAASDYAATQQSVRVFAEFPYQTQDSWTRERRVVAKAEHLAKGANPRFVVTSLPPEAWAARRLYETLYCARGEMENRIKEQQLDLFADRTSTRKLWSNQIRLYFSSLAYVLLAALRRLGLPGTAMEKAQCGTIRLRLLKIGAQIQVSARKVWVRFSSSYADQALFARIWAQLRC
jgi:hypothetical protein